MKSLMKASSMAIASHSQRKHDAIPVKDTVELARQLDPDADVVALDEVQFMDEGLIPIIEDLANRGVRVMAAGLDLDSNGEPFGIMPLLLAKAEYVPQLHAIR